MEGPTGTKRGRDDDLPDNKHGQQQQQQPEQQQQLAAAAAMGNKRQRVQPARASRPNDKEWTGSTAEVYANFFMANTRELLVGINQYDIKFHEGTKQEGTEAIIAGDAVELTRRRGQALLRNLDIPPECEPYLFDGNSLYVNGKPLPENMVTPNTEGMEVRKPLLLKDPRGNNSFIVYLREARVKDLVQRTQENSEFERMLFNLLVRKVIGSMKLKMLGRDLFDLSTEEVILRGEYALMTGYKTAMKRFQCGLALNVDLCFKLISKVDVLTSLQQKLRARSAEDVWNAHVVNRTVITRYNNATYRISRVEFNQNPRSTFMQKDKGPISYIDYYKSRYNENIKDGNQPLLVSEQTRRNPSSGQKSEHTVMLIPELCFLTGITEELRNSHINMREIASKTAIEGPARKAKLESFMESMTTQTSPAIGEAKKWGLELNPHFLKTDSKVLPVDKIMLGKDTTADIFKGSWHLIWRNTRSPMLRPCKNIGKWIIFYTSNERVTAQRFSEDMRNLAAPMGFMISNPIPCEVADQASAFVDKISEIRQEDNIQLIVCVLPTKNEIKYNAIKRLVTTKTPVPCQCIVAANYNKQGNNPKPYISGVLQQVVAKLGGAPWTVTDVQPPIPVMTCGISFSTSRGRSGRQQIVLGFVASIDRPISSWFTQSDAMDVGQEIATKIAVFLKAAVKAFKEHNKGVLPHGIIIYREGVGEGTINAVIDTEVGQIKNALAEDAISGWLIFITVETKSIARFVSGAQHTNPDPGTVIDRACVLSAEYDFYIVSQAPRQGAVSPTHYHVLADSSQLPPTELQNFTYRLCHLYYNWLGTIATPAPLRYAYKLAVLRSASQAESQHEHLSNSLYFL